MTRPEPGIADIVLPGLRRVLAPNPGPMTHWGTNSFIVGENQIAIIDPGPDDAVHLEALLRATNGETVTHILVTHAHADHSPLARRLSKLTGAPVLAFGSPNAGRTQSMQALSAGGLSGGGEGVDHDFRPDETLVEGHGWALDVLHTPGHFAGHLSFKFGDALISGDHVMDWSSSLVSPPDGDLRAFMATSERLRDLERTRLVPAHGGIIEDPGDRLTWLIEHRRSREAAILDAVHATPQSVFQITERVYTDIPSHMLPAAARNVLAHLIDLVDRKLVLATPLLALDANFTRA